MALSEEMKKAITLYLLEKIRKGEKSPVKKAAEALSVTPRTVYQYLEALEKSGDIEKVKRGEYRLVTAESEVTLFRGNGELVSEDKIVEKYILPRLKGLPDNVAEMWNYILGEMINNIIDHSEAEKAVITVRKNCLETTVRLYDDGIGIFEKIRSYCGFETVDDAVGELFKGKLTTDREHHSGEGIFFSSRMADEFYILSSGKVFSHQKFSPDCLGDWTEDAEAKGTTVLIVLSNHTQRKAMEVFDTFADIHGGFTKTRVPIRYYFDNAPVSRSQAKRLCRRLDQFREVELDFEGMEWMGQGFAHQLFVVFQNEHPEVRLLPINMKEDVEKMLVHVCGKQG